MTICSLARSRQRPYLIFKPSSRCLLSRSKRVGFSISWRSISAHTLPAPQSADTSSYVGRKQRSSARWSISRQQETARAVSPISPGLSGHRSRGAARPSRLAAALAAPLESRNRLLAKRDESVVHELLRLMSSSDEFIRMEAVSEYHDIHLGLRRSYLGRSLRNLQKKFYELFLGLRGLGQLGTHHIVYHPISAMKDVGWAGTDLRVFWKRCFWMYGRYAKEIKAMAYNKKHMRERFQDPVGYVIAAHTRRIQKSTKVLKVVIDRTVIPSGRHERRLTQIIEILRLWEKEWRTSVEVYSIFAAERWRRATAKEIEYQADLLLRDAHDSYQKISSETSPFEQALITNNVSTIGVTDLAKTPKAYQDHAPSNTRPASSRVDGKSQVTRKPRATEEFWY